MRERLRHESGQRSLHQAKHGAAWPRLNSPILNPFSSKYSVPIVNKSINVEGDGVDFSGCTLHVFLCV